MTRRWTSAGPVETGCSKAFDFPGRSLFRNVEGPEAAGQLAYRETHRAARIPDFADLVEALLPFVERVGQSDGLRVHPAPFFTPNFDTVQAKAAVALADVDIPPIHTLPS